MKNKVQVDNPREIALKILYEVDQNKAYSNISLNKHLKNSVLTAVDKSFITGLVYGVIKNKGRIDWIISKYAKTPIKKMSPWVKNILRLGIFQLLFLDKVPQSAAVNESVNLGKKYGHKKISGFINGILRSIVRAKEVDLEPKNVDNIDYLSIYYSHPKWMVEKWIKEYGEDFTIELLKANNSIPTITLRTNTLKITKKELMKTLAEEGFKVKEGQWSPEAILVENLSNIENIESFKKGLYQIQDQSSMLVSHILDPGESELILDLCSAPGGKTTHIAQLMDNTGEIIARDIHDHKLSLMEKNNKRLGISNIKLELYDALKLDHKLIKKANRVLLDAPCSGLGIIRKKPDLKWNKNVSDLNSIEELQLKMLENAAAYVKDSGILVYSTCTINPDENIEIIKRFLQDNKEFHLIPIEPISIKMKKHPEIEKGYLQTFPNLDEIDGFFICKMQRL